MWDLGTFLEAAPVIGQVLLVTGMIVGLILWLLGRKMARSACAASGLVLAGTIAAVITSQWDQPVWQLGVIIASGIGGCLIAFLLFRIWMGLSCAVILALGIPAASLVWSDAPAPLAAKQSDDVTLKQQVAAAGEQLAQSLDLKQDDDDGAQVADAIETLVEQFDDITSWLLAEASDWWEHLQPAGRRTVYITAAIGGLIGLLGGLIFPYAAASLHTAPMGTLLILGCGAQLIRMHTTQTPQWMHQPPAVILLVIGLITLIGIVLQWTVFRKKADG